MRQPEGASSLALIDDHLRQFWLLDATPDFPRQYDYLLGELGESYQFSGIILTHAHIGHYLGLVYLGREAMATNGVPIICSSSLATFLGTHAPFSQLVALSNIRLTPLSPSTPLQLGSNITIELWPVPHRNEFSDTMAILVRGPTHSLLYLPDIDSWQEWDRSLTQVVQGVDISLLDGTFFDETELPNRPRADIPHPCAQETIAYFDKHHLNPQGRVYFTHLNHSNPLWDAAFAAKIEDKGFRIARRGQQYVL